MGVIDPHGMEGLDCKDLCLGFCYLLNIYGFRVEDFFLNFSNNKLITMVWPGLTPGA